MRILATVFAVIALACFALAGLMLIGGLASGFRGDTTDFTASMIGVVILAPLGGLCWFIGQRLRPRHPAASPAPPEAHPRRRYRRLD